MMRVMVTGAAGQLGSALAQRAGSHTIVPFTRTQLDIGDRGRGPGSRRRRPA